MTFLNCFILRFVSPCWFGCRIDWSPLRLRPSLDHRWNEVRPMIVTYRADIYGAPAFSAPHRRPRPLRRDLEEWRTGRGCDAMRCDAMRCGRPVPKYQITGVWTELLARAAPGRVALEFLLVIHGRLRKANKSIRARTFLRTHRRTSLFFPRIKIAPRSLDYARQFLQNFLRW